MTLQTLKCVCSTASTEDGKKFFNFLRDNEKNDGTNKPTRRKYN